MGFDRIGFLNFRNLADGELSVGASGAVFQPSARPNLRMLEL